MAAVLAVAGTAFGQIVPEGPRFYVRSVFEPEYLGIGPSAAAAPDGTFVVAWSQGDALLGQRLAADGAKIGTEFTLLPTTPPFYQLNPDIAFGGNDKFLLVHGGPDQDGPGILVQAFNADGAPAGTEYVANSYWTGFQGGPRVAARDDGSFVLSWMSNSDVYVRSFDNSGAPLGTELLANEYTPLTQYSADVATMRNGDFVVAWGEAYGQSCYDYLGSRLSARRFARNGQAVGTEFTVAETVECEVSFNSSRVEAHESVDRYAVVWNRYVHPGRTEHIEAKAFSGNNLPVNDTSVLTTDGRAYTSSMLVGGGFVVAAWDYNTYDLVAREFGPSGGPKGPLIYLAGPMAEGDSAVVPQPDGKFVVVWHDSPGDGSDSIVGQRFAPVCGDGVLVSGEDCDDGNTVAGDCCPSSCRFDACRRATRSQLKIRHESDGANDKLSWKWQKGAATLLSDFGSPESSTTYRLCLFDGRASENAFLGERQINPGTAWHPQSGTGYSYDDRTGASSGITRVKLKAGIEERASVSLQGAGVGLNMPAPFAAFQYFGEDPTITVELMNDQGQCWISEFAVDDTKTNSAGRFSARTR